MCLLGIEYRYGNVPVTITAISTTRRYVNDSIYKTVHYNNTGANIELQRCDYYVVVPEGGGVLEYVMLGVRSGLVRSATSDC